MIYLIAGCYWLILWLIAPEGADVILFDMHDGLADVCEAPTVEDEVIGMATLIQERWRGIMAKQAACHMRSVRNMEDRRRATHVQFHEALPSDGT